MTSSSICRSNWSCASRSADRRRPNPDVRPPAAGRNDMIRNLIALTAATLAVAGFAADAQAKGKTFALIQYNQQVSFFTDITRGAQKAADAAGDKLLVFDANNSA